MKLKSKILLGVLAFFIVVGIVFYLISTRKYTVDFHTMGGTIYESQHIKNGEKAINPGDPYLEGFTFLYWVDEETGEKFTFDTPIDHNIVLKSVYQDQKTSEIF